MDNNEAEKGKKISKVEEQADNNNLSNNQFYNEEDSKMQGEINDNLDNGIKINLKEDKKSAISNNKEKKEIDNYSLFIKIEDMEKKLKECEEKIDALTNGSRP